MRLMQLSRGRRDACLIPMLDTPALSAFVAVVDAGSAHAAARRLGLSQAALSRRLQRLETSLGIKLFVRAGRGLALSAQGSALLPKVRAHLEGLSDALKTVRDDVRYGVPTVTFGCLPTLCTSVLPQALATVSKRHPDIRLRIHDLSATEIRHNIADGSADVAVTYLGIEESGFSQQAIIEEPMVLVVAKEHALAQQTHLAWSALRGVDLIGIGPQSGLRRLLEDARPIIGFDLNWRHEVQHITTALQLVASGYAMTVAPLLALQGGAGDHLHAIRLGETPLHRRLGSLWRAGERLTPEAEAVRREVGAALRAELALRMNALMTGHSRRAEPD
ncbi:MULTISPECIES: LysR family transcriptional regulator [unclassified Beijerinckia]|uniref:LysR family transcriptional regulator n=1 Tax=unclassified Beijerinckia TaxID=2638183 RepID=UPI00089A6608|nr:MULTISPECIES: LysR family transcriptional regulator [unclassified Beijerinckia]MDH7796649.1 DNA-binding transcriptional LysR family regulator [Beijerinckia sp. GAS462]SEC54115.1 DNA-binding transcriptional regulator, LysR family [Beijerinckia sp. 28-YEA-48]